MQRYTSCHERVNICGEACVGLFEQPRLTKTLTGQVLFDYKLDHVTV